MVLPATVVDFLDENLILACRMRRRRRLRCRSLFEASPWRSLGLMMLFQRAPYDSDIKFLRKQQM
jgi:hypothetical protein